MFNTIQNKKYVTVTNMYFLSSGGRTSAPDSGRCGEFVHPVRVGGERGGGGAEESASERGTTKLVVHTVDIPVVVVVVVDGVGIGVSNGGGMEFSIWIFTFYYLLFHLWWFILCLHFKHPSFLH